MAERKNVEIINRAQVTPKRLHALVRLVARRRRANREEILTLLQPAELGDKVNTDSAAAVFAAAVNNNLIIHDTAEDVVTLAPEVTPARIESSDNFRSIMQERLCGVTDPDEDNFLLNQITAWYAVQSHDLYKLKKTDFASKFNIELYRKEVDADDEGGRTINDTKLNSWYRWAVFLGWGFIYNTDFWPVAHLRLLPKLAPLRGQKVGFAEFMQLLPEWCPEMDGGTLFEQAWILSRPGHARSQQLSFMLSTTLGTLHGMGRIRLERTADAFDRWQIYQSTGYPFSDVTHITVVEQKRGHKPRV